MSGRVGPEGPKGRVGRHSTDSSNRSLVIMIGRPVKRAFLDICWHGIAWGMGWGGGVDNGAIKTT